MFFGDPINFQTGVSKTSVTPPPVVLWLNKFINFYTYPFYIYLLSWTITIYIIVE